MLKRCFFSSKIAVAALLAAWASMSIPLPPCLADPVVVETKVLPSEAADPFAGFISVGPRHEFEPVYRVLEPGACAQAAHRVLILNYANYDSLVIEELGFAGRKCRDIKVRKSFSVNGVTLGYALGEGTRFAWNIEFIGWAAWDIFVIRSAKKDFRIRVSDDGKIQADAVKNQDAAHPSTRLGTGSTPLDSARGRQNAE